MKTIAVSIDDATIEAVRRIASRGRIAGSGRRGGRTNVSQIVRNALHEYLERREKRAREERDRAIIAKHRELLRRQALALVEDQAPL